MQWGMACVSMLVQASERVQMKLKMNIVDAFTQERFKGNSAAVIVTEDWLAPSLMQTIAMENNLSETAFLVQNQDGSYAIRWFSPITEIDFCGHATLASASVIFETHPQQQDIVFVAEAVGTMTVTKASDGRIEMDFPNRMPSVLEEVPDELVAGLSIPPIEVLQNGQAYFAVYQHEDDVHALVQTPEVLKKLAPYDVVATAKGKDYDFVSRYFWPANGGDEDPVTGSIHTGLAPFWAERLGKVELVALQASSRTGVLYCDVSPTRVRVSGFAVPYLEGTITV